MCGGNVLGLPVPGCGGAPAWQKRAWPTEVRTLRAAAGGFLHRGCGVGRGVAVRVCSAPEQRDGGGDQACGDGEVEGGGQAVAEGWADDRGEEGASGQVGGAAAVPAWSAIKTLSTVGHDYRPWRMRTGAPRP